MTREYCLKVAKLKGFDFETARELTTFIAPRRRFDGVVAAWREYLQWKYAGTSVVTKRPRNSFFLVDAHPSESEQDICFMVDGCVPIEAHELFDAGDLH